MDFVEANSVIVGGGSWYRLSPPVPLVVLDTLPLFAIAALPRTFGIAPTPLNVSPANPPPSETDLDDRALSRRVKFEDDLGMGKGTTGGAVKVEGESSETLRRPRDVLRIRKLGGCERDDVKSELNTSGPATELIPFEDDAVEVDW